VYAARFSPDGLRVATTDDAAVDVWDARTGRLERRLDGHTGRVLQVAWHPDSSRLVSASRDGTARVWRVADGAAELVIGAPGAPPLFSADFAPSGDRIATTREDGEVALVDAASGSTVAIHRDPDTRFTVAFDRKGERALSCTFLLTAKLWRVSDGARLTELIGHTGDLTSCGLSPDGALAITGSADGTARIWDAATGAALAILRNPRGQVNAARFSPDGTRAVVAGAGGAMIFDLPRFTGGQSGLERLVRCRVPYALDRELVTSRSRDRSACAP
jgi:WD40 repeat protein